MAGYLYRYQLDMGTYCGYLVRLEWQRGTEMATEMEVKKCRALAKGENKVYVGVYSHMMYTVYMQYFKGSHNLKGLFYTHIPFSFAHLEILVTPSWL